MDSDNTDICLSRRVSHWAIGVNCGLNDRNAFNIRYVWHVLVSVDRSEIRKIFSFHVKIFFQPNKIN